MQLNNASVCVHTIINETIPTAVMPGLPGTQGGSETGPEKMSSDGMFRGALSREGNVWGEKSRN